MKKSEIRKLYMRKRKELSYDEVMELSEKIFGNFINYFSLSSGQKIHIFIPIEKFNEIRTEFFTDYLLNRKIHVFVPKIVNMELISVEIFPDTEFETNSWGISEPVSDKDSGELHFDMIITPLLYCDASGNRVGYGKGFYDSFFEKVSPETKKTGINYFNPDVMVEDVWENDIPLDYLVTPTEVLSFLRGSE